MQIYTNKERTGDRTFVVFGVCPPLVYLVFLKVQSIYIYIYMLNKCSYSYSLDIKINAAVHTHILCLVGVSVRVLHARYNFSKEKHNSIITQIKWVWISTNICRCTTTNPNRNLHHLPQVRTISDDRSALGWPQSFPMLWHHKSTMLMHPGKVAFLIWESR